GGSGLTKTGTATLTLDGVNTFTGPTLVSAGTLQYATSHTTGASLTVSDGATAFLKPSVATPNLVVVKTASVGTSTTGRIDIGDNKLIITTPSSVGTFNGTNYTGTTGLIASGRNANPAPGLWDGSGIV